MFLVPMVQTGSGDVEPLMAYVCFLAKDHGTSQKDQDGVFTWFVKGTVNILFLFPLLFCIKLFCILLNQNLILNPCRVHQHTS